MAIIPTIQQIEKLAESARSGNAEALAELGALNNKLSKRANQRMTEIEKSSSIVHTDAYDRAQGFLENVSDSATRNKSGNMRFSQSKKLDVDALEENLDNVTRFLRDETSKVSGEKLRRAEEAFESLKMNNVIEDLSEKNKKKFFRFLSTDAWKDIKKHLGSGFIKEARDAISSGYRVGDLKRMYNEYITREDVDIFQVTDAWISGKRKI